MITKYGLDVAIPIIVLSLVLIGSAMFVSIMPLRITMLILGILVLLFTLNFFRDPERTTPDVQGAVIAPADGKIVNIGEVEEHEYLGGKAMQVCIFMSPLNVHVNRFPVSGTIEYFRHVEGRFVAAFEDKASELNERTLIGINTGSYRMLFKQIAGFIARRIVCPIAVGDSARVGERFGMIKFGSRVDVLMPVDADVRVRLDQHVVAGETVLAIVKQ